MNTNSFRKLQKYCNSRLLIIVLQVIIIVLILKSEVHQLSSPNRMFVNNLTVSTNTKNEITLTKLESKYLTSKGRLHHYTRFYDRYFSKYRNTYFRFLEIGLGCGMPWGVGVSAALWREYFGSMADIHFIEYDKQCGEKWSKQTGQKVCGKASFEKIFKLNLSVEHNDTLWISGR